MLEIEQRTPSGSSPYSSQLSQCLNYYAYLIYFSPEACNGPRQEPYLKYWHAGSLGADGEDYRAEYVHAPFPKISTQHHDCP